MKSLLLLDADIVIDLHKIGLWKAVTGRYKVHLPSTIIGEIKHYRKGSEQIPASVIFTDEGQEAGTRTLYRHLSGQRQGFLTGSHLAQMTGFLNIHQDLFEQRTGFQS